MANIEDIPAEVVAVVFSHLGGKDIACASMVCRKFYEASRTVWIWRHICKRDYGVMWMLCNPSPRDFYQKVLHKYGMMLGVWQRDDTSPYGGLVEVKHEEDKILVLEWKPPKYPCFTESLRKKILFSIRINGMGCVELHCLQGTYGEHNCCIEYCPQSVIDKYAVFNCVESNRSENDSTPNLELYQWLRDEDYLDNDFVELQIEKFMTLRNHNLLLKPIKITHCDSPVFQSGLFKGTYSAHGLELILVQFKNEGQKMEGVKISGDPNIPAGCVSVTANLLHPIVLTYEEQESLQTISAVQPQKELRNNLENLLPQPFRVPSDCEERVNDDDIPKFCKARFSGYGQIAQVGYASATFTPGQWIIFDENLFGFLWFKLRCISMYHRVQEDLNL